MHWSWVFFYYILALIKCNAEDIFDSDIGDSCTNAHKPGICKLVTNCPSALAQLKQKHTHNFTRCGFQSFDEIVCCPLNKTMYNPVTDMPASHEDDGTSHPSRFHHSKGASQEACDKVKVYYQPSIATLYIIDGTAAEEGEFPHMAALGYESDERISWECGATVISDQFLVTAAHCLIRKTPSIVRLGVLLLNDSNPLDFGIEEVLPHQEYSIDSKQNDIGLIKVNRTITFSEKITPACLYTEDDDPMGLVVTGWGKTQPGVEDDRSNNLQKTGLLPFSLTECDAMYRKRTFNSKFITKKQMCVYKNGTDSCLGDSGGPLQIRGSTGKYYLVGIVSYGAGCGTKVPSVYTRVSSFIDWIEQYVWKTNKPH